MTSLNPLRSAARSLLATVHSHSTAPQGTKATEMAAEMAAPARVPRRPSVEYFDLADCTKTDARGFVHSVESYHAEPWGLYLIRKADAPPNRYTETWLLPGPSVRITMSHVNTAHDRDPIYHVYLGEFAKLEPKRWRAVYHYLDIVCRNGRAAELHGLDDLFAAHEAGYVDATEAQRIIERANTLVSGVAAHGHHLERWLDTHGITLTWL
jgi:predicted RNA-binding protein associated with RNAse of E/G family